MLKGFLVPMLTTIFSNFGTVYSAILMIFASLTRDCEGSKRDQQLQPQLHCIHCVLQLYLLEQANALQLSLYFRAHVASAAESMKLNRRLM